MNDSGSFGSVTARDPRAIVSTVGIAIRYGFYAIGAAVLALVGVTILSARSVPPKPVDERPAFGITASALSGLPASGHVVSSSRYGRAEVRQYGRFYNRSVDLAVVMVLPPRGIGMGTEFVQDLREANLLRTTRAVMLPTHYDLDTRFGEFRATDMRVDTDGRWKQCLAFRSRLDTAAIYLTGWFCDATGARPSAEALACMLDKFTLDRELASKEADTFLRTRMARPPFCQAVPVTQTTDIGGNRMSPPARWSQPSAVRRY